MTETQRTFIKKYRNAVSTEERSRLMDDARAERDLHVFMMWPR